jgi:hypothetical protein
VTTEGTGMADLRRAEAKFRVWRNRDAIAEVVAASVELLVAGSDTPNLRILAGEDRAEPDEVEAVLNATLSDLGLDRLTRQEAVLAVGEQLARRAIADEAAAAEVAPIIWHLYAREPMATEWPLAFERLAYAADLLEDLPDAISAMPDFMSAARDFIAAAGQHAE